MGKGIAVRTLDFAELGQEQIDILTDGMLLARIYLTRREAWTPQPNGYYPEPHGPARPAQLVVTVDAIGVKVEHAGSRGVNMLLDVHE